MFGHRKSFVGIALSVLLVFGCSGQDGTEGPRGETGVAGLEGTQGPAGPAGPAGPGGPQGAPGEPGTKGPRGEPATLPLVVSALERGTYVQLSQDWWRWAYSMPKAGHPLAGGADCSRGQSGPIWFLGGAFEPGAVTRTCTVPAGKALFFPIINVAYNNLDEEPQKTDAELHQLASLFGSAATGISAEIDGVPVSGIEDYHVHSNVFPMWWPDAPVFDDAVEAGETVAVTDGYYLLVNPLPTGAHTIKFKGSLVFTEDKVGFDYTVELDVTYNLTVQ